MVHNGPAVAKFKMVRIKFNKGKQRIFLKKVLENLNCPSLRALTQFGFDIPYSTLKNYFNESRTLPEDFFNDLCYLVNMQKTKLKIILLDENWGRIKGGKIKNK